MIRICIMIVNICSQIMIEHENNKNNKNDETENPKNEKKKKNNYNYI